METDALNSVDVEWVEISNQRCLKLTIRGQLTEKSAAKATSKWKEEFALNLKPGEKAVVICSCNQMDGYETNARKLRQQTIGELKTQIGHFWIVTNNKLFKAVAQTMGLLTQLKIRTADTDDKVNME